MAEPRSGPVSLTRYRPILYLFTGVVATYAIIYLSHNLFSSQPSSQGPLRRRNALRRTRPSDGEELRLEDSPSYRAITHLELLERQNGMYGTFRIETEDGRRVESGLLPSLLATRDQLMEEVGVPEAHAERMREMMEDTFLESFLALDFPASHILPANSAERAYLTEQLQRRGISRAGIERALTRFNADGNYGDELRRRRQNGERVTLSTSTYPDTAAAPPETQDLEDGEPAVDDQSVFSWRDGNNDTSPTREGQNLLNLLYHIAEDQARRDGYIHRGVTCNSCGAMPIQGIRYRCANCIDYDLCETCESMQVHIKTHLFYKVRIPAPFLGNPRQSQPVWYPGKPTLLPRSLPRPLAKRLMRETSFENTELDALWDQFRCLANYEWPDDPNKLHMAIDRKTFDRCFVPNTSLRPPPPSLIYDRMFAFYDTNGDNLIGFEEFLKGLASLNNKSNDERLRRVFRGYDIDGDGYVERKDFLRVFRAYYTLSRELTRDMVAGMEDDFLEGGARDVVLGSQPISSAFPGTIPAGAVSRTGEGKRINTEGDMEIVDNGGILRQDGTDTGDRHRVIGDAAVREQFGRTRPMFPSTLRLPNNPDPAQGDEHEHENDEENDPSGSEESSQSSTGDTWPLPREHMNADQIMDAMGTIRDDEQSRMAETRRHGIDERWRRRAFYTDEEDGARIPDGYQIDSDFDELTDEPYVDEQSESHPPSPRSRSSSKVRFEDDIADDYDVRSNPSTSSRSIPVGERWGGFEIPEVERDVGKEVLYQVTQQGFNELLDVLFKPKEDLMMEVHRTRVDRKLWAQEIEQYENSRPQQASPTANDGVVFPKDEEHLQEITDSRSLDDLLSHAGYAVHSPILEPIGAQPVLAPPLLGGMSPDDDVRPTHLVDPDHEDGLGQDQPFEEEYDDDGDDDDGSFNTADQIRYSEYASFEEAFDTEPGSSLEDIADYDPTLPQFRPQSAAAHLHLSFHDEPTIITGEEDSAVSSPDLPGRLRLEPNSTTSLPAPSSPHSSSPGAEETAPKPPPSPMQPLPPPPRAASAPRDPVIPHQPTPETLARWAYLNQAERVAKERGGGAKLNFEEFSRRMAADKGRRLGFVASWIEMASF